MQIWCTKFWPHTSLWHCGFFFSPADRKLHFSKAQSSWASTQHSQLARVLPLAGKQSACALCVRSMFSKCLYFVRWAKGSAHGEFGRCHCWNTSTAYPISLSLSVSHAHTHTHTHREKVSLFLCLSHTHTVPLTSLSLSHTHTQIVPLFLSFTYTLLYPWSLSLSLSHGHKHTVPLISLSLSENQCKLIAMLTVTHTHMVTCLPT